MTIQIDDVDLKFISNVLQEQNPNKSLKEINDLFLDCLESRMDSWEIHGFLISGYADDWKYKPFPEED